MGTNVAKEIKWHKIVQQWPSLLVLTCVQIVLWQSMPPTSRKSESWKNLSTRKVASKHKSSCHSIQTRLSFIFSSVLFLLAPMPSFFHSFLTSCSLTEQGQDWFNLYHQKNDLRSCLEAEKILADHGASNVSD